MTITYNSAWLWQLAVLLRKLITHTLWLCISPDIVPCYQCYAGVLTFFQLCNGYKARTLYPLVLPLTQPLSVVARSESSVASGFRWKSTPLLGLRYFVIRHLTFVTICKMVFWNTFCFTLQYVSNYTYRASELVTQQNSTASSWDVHRMQKRLSSFLSLGVWDHILIIHLLVEGTV